MGDGRLTTRAGRALGYPMQAALGGLINSTLQLVQAFGASLTRDQDAAITGLVNAAYVLTMAYLAYRANGNNRPAAP